MANTFTHSPQQLATVAAKLAGADFNLAKLISTNAAADFAEGTGATVRIPVPGAIPTHSKLIGDKSTALIADELAEKYIDVTLTDHLYSLTVLSEGDLSLELEDYARQVLAPQTRAIAAKIEALTAATMSATPETTSVAYSATAPAKAITAARRILRTNGVPESAKLFAAVGASVYADLLDAPASAGFDANGKTVRGVEVIESTRLADSAIAVFIPEAFALVARAPKVPQGAAYGASITTPVFDDKRGVSFAVRVINDYDSNVAADRSLVSSFVKVAAMPLPVDRENGTVDLVEHGGVVRIDTAAA
ncbi:P22 phage major capsid protein family protein [Microbacterium sp. ARD31]|uniref:hypothetical protein n=1 Tax=Microbacterium sp. ARD31 TaxID=2962576 RepID=UPI002880ED43|nr:hypothetical protein [Microbacterium sp. ARD31]MDT0179937.1 P22 phage major capsid protein family protein [Microbacterium sp. ARD31]